MSKRKIILIMPITVLAIVALVLFIMENNLKKIDKNEIDVSKYIIATDEVSKGKAQVNWKYVASIIGVLNKNNFKDISTNEIKEIANLFLKKEQYENEYYVLSLNKVLPKLKMKEKQVNRVNDYVKDLEYFGLIPERLSPNEKYSKFIDEIKEAAIKNYKNYNILPSITISQAILESNWGESKLSKKYNNLFGIKAHSYWDGESISIETSEYYNETIKDKFRVYNNQSESIDDHAKFLTENQRYDKVFNKKTYISQAKALEEAGYSTVSYEDGEPKYKDLLVQIIRQYNLQLIDSKVQEK